MIRPYKKIDYKMVHKFIFMRLRTTQEFNFRTNANGHDARLNRRIGIIKFLNT